MRRLATVLVLVAGVTACGSGDRAVVVGAVYPTGGHQGPGGIEEYRGVELAAEYVNRDAGTGGRAVELRLRPAGHREEAPAAIDRLADDGVQVVLGSYGSTISLPAARAAARRGLVFWETGAVGDLPMPSSESGATFRYPATGRFLGRQAVAFVEDELELGDELTYTVAYVDDVYGRSVGAGALAEIAERGVKLGADLAYELASVDYDDLVDRIERAGTDVLVVAAYLDDGVALRRAIVRRGLDLRANIGTSSSYCMLQFGSMLGPDAVGLFASDKPDGPAVKAERLRPDAAAALRWARRTYEQRFGTAMTAPALTGFSGALALFRHVLPRADGDSARAIARAAMRADVPRGALPDGGGLKFSERPSEVRTNERATSVIWEWVARDNRAVVWPPSAASHDIVAPG
ncbi:MAG: ABC transporter substrate-binding protein [Actinomycetota bacterium]